MSPRRKPPMFGALVVALACSVIGAACVQVTPESRLERSPYLTAVFGDRATVNWATDRSQDTGSVRWGPAPGCDASETAATKIGIEVNGEHLWQWRADLSGLSPDDAYCYRPMLGTTDLLQDDASPSLRAALAPGDATAFSFAVLGDWGQGSSDESGVLRQIGRSSARFVVTVGDNAYPSGTQTDYGVLDRGNVFARDQLPLIGPRPVFAAQGNHGFTSSSAYLENFPAVTAADASGGRYRQEDYCCISAMPSHEDRASAWYAFDWGSARFYVLEAAWSDGLNDYRGDFEAHWNGPVPGCPACGSELEWLRGDLAAHASTPAKFAFFHYPLHSDSSAQPGNSFLAGADRLEGLLAQNGVSVAFTGHTHVYERNHPQVGSLVTYVTGGGGGTLSRINSCRAFDAYAVGVDSACRAPIPDSSQRVFHYLLVTVNGNQISVTPTDAEGRTFDVQTFEIGARSASAPP